MSNPYAYDGPDLHLTEAQYRALPEEQRCTINGEPYVLRVDPQGRVESRRACFCFSPAQEKALAALQFEIRSLAGYRGLGPQHEARAQNLAHHWLLRAPHLKAAEVLRLSRDLAERDGCGCCEEICRGLRSDDYEPVLCALLLAR